MSENVHDVRDDEIIRIENDLSRALFTDHDFRQFDTYVIQYYENLRQNGRIFKNLFTHAFMMTELDIIRHFVTRHGMHPTIDHLQLVSYFDKSFEIAKYLLQNFELDANDANCIFFAIEHSNIRLVEYLIENNHVNLFRKYRDEYAIVHASKSITLVMIEQFFLHHQRLLNPENSDCYFEMPILQNQRHIIELLWIKMNCQIRENPAIVDEDFNMNDVYDAVCQHLDVRSAQLFREFILEPV